MQFRLAILAALLSQVWALVVPLAGGRTISRSWTMSTGKMPAWLRSTIVSIGVAAGTLGAPTLDPAGTIARAADTVKVGKCLLQSCQKELGECLLNPKCLANIVCLNACNGRPDEAECQIKCGDTFENEVVGRFNTCAVSQKKCVPQKQDEGLYPLPLSTVSSFDTSIWNGRWYISAGLNKIFDTFDCQVHFFTSPYPGKFYAKLFWRITEPDGEFFTKNAIQRFVQDPKNPGHLINHDNEYLHYKDDWYVLDYEPNDFVLVYYKGSNDAWDGYGGAFLYTRAPTVRKDLVPRLEKAMESSGLPYAWKDFTLTDNSCKAQTEDITVLREKFVGKVVLKEEQALAEQLTALRYSAVNEVIKEERGFEKTIRALEKEVERYVLEVEKDLEAVEKEIAKDLNLAN
jgi:violaxanthin de-epoxidase